MSYCIGLGNHSDSDWDRHFAQTKSRYIEIDNAITSVIKRALEICSARDASSIDFVVRAYDSLVSLNRKLADLIDSYQTDRARVTEGYRLLFKSRTSSMEAMSCARQVSGLELTARDTVHFYASVFNLKLTVCKEFSGILNMSSYDVLTSSMLPVGKRVKRWFFTGLADNSSREVE
jgi:hypothetical protein